MTRRTTRRKKNGAKVLFIIEMIVLAVLIAGIFFFAKIRESFDNFYSARIENGQNNEGQGNAAPTPKIEINAQVAENEKLSGYRNIALIGIDARSDNMDYANSDTMIIASINNDTQGVRLLSVYRDTCLYVGEQGYRKANAAYAYGSSNQLLTMMNKNLDLAMTDYVVVNMDAVAELVDCLGGIQITMLADEVLHMNNYCVETSEITGRPYTRIEPEVSGTYNLNGVQAVAYSRIRYTIGNDFKRTERQRLVIEKVIEKLKKQGVSSFPQIADRVFPLIKTNLSKTEIIKLGSQVFNYTLEKSAGFPFTHVEANINGGSYVVPVTLLQEVRDLHAWMFDDEGYEPSDAVRGYSDDIAALSGYGEDYIERAKELSNMANPSIGSEADGS